jgi:DNA-binding LacI/PurR family transcriptional regulator
MSTVRAIAEATGLSVATVSRALSGSPSVKDETRAAVDAAVHRLGYHRQPVGRQRQRQRTRRAIGLCAGKRMRPAVMHDPVYSQIFDHLDFLLGERGFELVRIDAYIDERDGQAEAAERRLRQRILDEELSGVLVYGDGIGDGLEDYLRQRLLPLLHVNRHRRVPAAVSCAAFDQRAGAEAATRHLLALGHQRILLVLPEIDVESEVIDDRLAGYRSALLERNAAGDEGLILRPPSATMAFGHQAMQRRLAERERDFTAVFANNDETAVGVLRACREAGIAVPDEVALVGFDDLPVAAYLDPALTTIRQDFARLARAVVDGFLPRCAAGAPQGPLRLVLEPELVVRGSCGARRGGHA